MWAIRCVHEAKMHEDNCFVTLTYRDGDLPVHGTLVKHHFQDFLKRLRAQHCEYEENDQGDRVCTNPISYFHCGEYGKVCPYCRERHGLGRPHYHALLFGYWPDDCELYQEKNGVRTYTSAKLARVWKKGFVVVADVTPQSAAYCTRYVLKKRTGCMAPEWYVRIDCRSGELLPLAPEYATMSRNPAVGRRYYDEFGEDVYPEDNVVINGFLMKPPRYYDELFKQENEDEFEELKGRRREAMKENAHNNTPARLGVRKQCHDAKLARSERSYEDESDPEGI